MAADERECVDLWSVLDDAETTVEGWPEWQREVQVAEELRLPPEA